MTTGIWERAAVYCFLNSGRAPSRVPRARVCSLDALTHAHAHARVVGRSRDARVCRHIASASISLTHTSITTDRKPSKRPLRRLSILRVVHIEIPREHVTVIILKSSYRTPARPHRAYARVFVSAFGPAHTCIRHRSNVEDKWVVLYSWYTHANYIVSYTMFLRGILTSDKNNWILKWNLCTQQ